MVESGSTTTYLGGDQPFPNWLLYDSSLFEVKLNGKAAIFYAPSPTHGPSDSGYIGFPGSSAQLPNDVVKGPDTGFNLFVNIEADGSVAPRPVVDKSTYLHQQLAPMSINNGLGLDDTKPLYLHTADWATMTGKNQLDVDINQHPYIECPELNLIIYYDPDMAQWRFFHGEVFTEVVLEWRFKELWSIDKAFPFIDMREWRVDQYLTQQADMLHPMVNVIPNEVEPTLLEVHARTYVRTIMYQDNNIYPRYQGVSITAWPNLCDKYDYAQFDARDKSVVMLGISSDVANNNALFRINNNPAWISGNTLPAEYNYQAFESFEVHVESPYTKGEVDTDGQLTITDGTTIVRYMGRTGLWSVVSSTEQYVTVEGMLLRDAEGMGPQLYSNVHYDMTATMITPQFGMVGYYFGFKLAYLNAIPLIASPDDVPVTTVNYLSHEYVTCQIDLTRNFKFVPNFETYGHQNFKLLVNGNEVTPTLQMGVNEVLQKVSYELPTIDGFLDIDVSNMTAYLDAPVPMFEGQASAPEGFTYFLDGDRETNLEMNSATCLFNRSIPIVLQWIYTAEVPHTETIPLFVEMYRNGIKTLEPNQSRDQGYYYDYFYTATGKTASLSIALPLNISQSVNYSSLAMKHERDVVRGWKKSGYTGLSASVQDFTLRRDSIGWPIVVRPDIPIEEPKPTVPTLPLTLDVNELGLQGEFDIRVNGQMIAGGVSGDVIKIALDSYGKFIVEETTDDVPDGSKYADRTGDVELTGTFDVRINGVVVANDVAVEDLIDMTALDDSIPLEVYPTLNESAPEVPPPPPPA